MRGFIVKVIEFKGQLCVPIPKEIARKLGIKEGDEVTVDLTSDKRTILIRKVK